MMQFTTDKLEVRSKLQDGVKKYFINGYASVAGIDSYKTNFTDKFRKSLQTQIKGKDLELDVQHQAALADNMMVNLLDLKKQFEREGKATDQIDKMIAFSKAKKFPFGKVYDSVFNEGELMIQTQANGHLKNIDEPYFDATWGMVQDKFLDGFSIEFDPSSVQSHKEYTKEGLITFIDDARVDRISLVSNAAHKGNQITEVFVRATLEKTGEEQMADDPKVAEEAQKKVDEAQKETEEAKAKVEAAVKETEEAKKEVDAASKENDDLKTKVDTLQTDLGEIKELLKAQQGKTLPDQKGVARQEDKYANLTPQETQAQKEKIEAELKIKELDELIKLQLETNN